MRGSKRVLYIAGMLVFVTMAVSVALFWARLIPAAVYYNNFHTIVNVAPSGLFSKSEESAGTRSQSRLTISSDFTWVAQFGLSEKMRKYTEGDKEGLIEYNEGSGAGGVPMAGYLKFNSKYGLIEGGGGREVKRDGKTFYVKEGARYIGPKGKSDKPEASLGRFHEIAAGEFYQTRGKNRIMVGTLVYDKVAKQFFAIIPDGNLKTVTVKASEVMSDDLEPVQIGEIAKNGEMLHVMLSSPYRKGDPNIFDERMMRNENAKVVYEEIDQSYPTIDAWLAERSSDGKVLVVLKSGVLKVFDVNTMAINEAGYLPGAEYEGTLDASLAYSAKVLTRNGQYGGVVATSLGRSGIELNTLVFDVNGVCVATAAPQRWRAYSRHDGMLDREVSKVFYSLISWCGYAVESLAGPVFGIGSFITGPRMEAESGYRSMFLVPNSVMGKRGIVFAVDRDKGIIFGLLAIAPSVLFGLFLAWRIRVDARGLGLGSQERMWWTVGAVALGLAAYITYRLTRPRVRMVTCVNCGKMRRPDMELCHGCGAGWHIPEIEAPLWRVVE